MIKIQKVVIWIPRVLGVLLALFVVYEMVMIPINRPGIKTSTARFLIDISLVLVVFALGWHRQGLGAISYLILGLYYAARVWDHGKYWIDYLLIGGSALILSILLFVAWIVPVIAAKVRQKKGMKRS